jgi:hypothetical protein
VSSSSPPNFPLEPTRPRSLVRPQSGLEHADLHGRHASRSSLRPRLRLSRRLARRREVGIERAAQLSVIVLGVPETHLPAMVHSYRNASSFR